MTKTTREVMGEEIEIITDLIVTFIDGAGVVGPSSKSTIRQSIIRVVKAALEESRIPDNIWGTKDFNQAREDVDDRIQQIIKSLE